IDGLRDPDRMVRTEAAWALRWSRSNAAAKALLAATRDPERIVAHYAAWTLRRCILPHCPDLPALKGRRVTVPPLMPEPHRPSAAAGAVDDDARAFEQFACSSSLPTCRAAMAARPPAADGHRGRAYAAAAAAKLIHIDGYPEPPVRPTEFRAVCSADALHMHIRCAYRGRGELAARHTEYGSSVHADNSVEVFLDPSGRGRGPYFQIAVNTRNARCDALTWPPGHTWKPAGRRGGETWRPAGVRSAVRVEKGFWTVEIVVPFADLGLRAGRINKLWRMNVVRNARLAEGQETTSWCDLGDYDAHQPGKFGWLWVDAGSVVNADAAVFEAEPLPLEPNLPGWVLLRGYPSVRDGRLVAPFGTSLLRWTGTIPHEAFEVTAEAMIRHQFRLLFSPDPANRQVSWMAAYINTINEINVAGMHRWDHWAPELPGHLGIFKEVYPRLTHSRWYEITVRVRPDRIQTLLDGAVHMELPNPNPDVRYLGMALIGGGSVRKLRLRPLG
ncbi:MAG TPA: carbohydrate-binding family 9-like protein, partial [Phycisphaerae bacterium]|nr:carbohydrate-binding family 9-like protein [Phycisphaerae bacterium]